MALDGIARAEILQLEQLANFDFAVLVLSEGRCGAETGYGVTANEQAPARHADRSLRSLQPLKALRIDATAHTVVGAGFNPRIPRAWFPAGMPRPGAPRWQCRSP